MTDFFREIRARVPAIDAARHYGLTFDSAGRRARCIFHDDHDPSMSFRNGRFRCWSCGASGTSIDLAMQLFGVSAVEAATIINRDFGLNLDYGTTTDELRADREIDAKHQAFEAWRESFIIRLNQVYRRGHLALLRGVDNEAIRYMERAAYCADTLSHGTPNEQAQIFRDRRQIESWIDKILKN